MDTVVVPVGQGDAATPGIVIRVVIECPVGYPVTGGIHTRHEAASRWRGDGARIGLHEFYAFLGQFLHVGRLVAVVQRCHFGVEGDRGLLPTHVVYEEQNNVGSFIGRPQTRCGNHSGYCRTQG